MNDKLIVKGICICKCSLWKWRLEDNQIILTCSKCGKKAHFGVNFPMIDMVLDSQNIT